MDSVRDFRFKYVGTFLHETHFIFYTWRDSVIDDKGLNVCEVSTFLIVNNQYHRGFSDDEYIWEGYGKEKDIKGSVWPLTIMEDKVVFYFKIHLGEFCMNSN